MPYGYFAKYSKPRLLVYKDLISTFTLNKRAGVIGQLLVIAQTFAGLVDKRANTLGHVRPVIAAGDVIAPCGGGAGGSGWSYGLVIPNAINIRTTRTLCKLTRVANNV